ncbi:MAG: ABC transporter ATP-binding protein [Lachnospiraceae bacterium]|nr:ABC transporter ATP-binding protein [Lachnospiraceae bacterium]
MALLTCKNLSFAYENQLVIDNLSFEVKTGDYLCIVGENGTGKTTLMKGLLGLKKPMKGEIQTGEGLRADQIGYLPQQTVAQRDFPASVMEVVLSGCLNSKGFSPFYSRADKNKASDHMKLLGIWDKRKECYRELSGGYKQRVLLARALCATSKVLLLDEPTTGLDPVAIFDFYEIVERLNRKHGITVIMISHDIKEAIKQADHILHLTQEDFFFGTTKQYLDSNLGKDFLGGHEDVE